MYYIIQKRLEAGLIWTIFFSKAPCLVNATITSSEDGEDRGVFVRCMWPGTVALIFNPARSGHRVCMCKELLLVFLTLTFALFQHSCTPLLRPSAVVRELSLLHCSQKSPCQMWSLLMSRSVTFVFDCLKHSLSFEERKSWRFGTTERTVYPKNVILSSCTHPGHFKPIWLYCMKHTGDGSPHFFHEIIACTVPTLFVPKSNTQVVHVSENGPCFLTIQELMMA